MDFEPNDSITKAEDLGLLVLAAGGGSAKIVHSGHSVQSTSGQPGHDPSDTFHIKHSVNESLHSVSVSFFGVSALPDFIDAGGISGEKHSLTLTPLQGLSGDSLTMTRAWGWNAYQAEYNENYLRLYGTLSSIDPENSPISGQDLAFLVAFLPRTELILEKDGVDRSGEELAAELRSQLGSAGLSAAANGLFQSDLYALIDVISRWNRPVYLAADGAPIASFPSLATWSTVANSTDAYFKLSGGVEYFDAANGSTRYGPMEGGFSLSSGSATVDNMVEIARSVLVEEGPLGVTNYRVNVGLAYAASSPVTITYTVTGTGPNEADAADFNGVFPSGTVIIGAGQTIASIVIPIVDDVLVEADENFLVTITSVSAGSGIVLGNDVAAGTIIDNDEEPEPAIASISAMSPADAEGDAGTTYFGFLIELDSPAIGRQTVSYETLSHVADVLDFAGGSLPAGAVTFQPGETSKTVWIGVAGDQSSETSERFYVRISNPTAGIEIGTSTASSLISDDDGAFLLRAPSNDPGNVSDALSQALDAFAATGGEALITFAAAASVHLDAPIVVRSGQTLTIDGDLDDDGSPDVYFSGDGLTHHFLVEAGGTLHLDGIVLSDGSSQGAAGDDGADGEAGWTGANGANGAAAGVGDYHGGPGQDGGDGGDGQAGGRGSDAAGSIVNYGTLSLRQVVFRDNTGIGGDGGNGGSGGSGGTGGSGGMGGPGDYHGTGNIGYIRPTTGGSGGDGGDGGTGGDAGEGGAGVGAIYNGPTGVINFIDTFFGGNLGLGGDGGVAGRGAVGGNGGSGGSAARETRYGEGGEGGDGGDGGNGGDNAPGGGQYSTSPIINEGFYEGNYAIGRNRMEPGSSFMGGDFGAGGLSGVGGSDGGPDGHRAPGGQRGLPGQPGQTIEDPPYGGGADEDYQTGVIYLGEPELAVLEGDAGISTLTFHVNRRADFRSEVAVDWRLVPGSGVTAGDFVDGEIPSGTVVFEGSPFSFNTIAVTIQIRADLLAEASEAFSIELSNIDDHGTSLGSYFLGSSSIRGVIINDDPVSIVYSNSRKEVIVSAQNSKSDFIKVIETLSKGMAIDIVSPSQIGAIGRQLIRADNITVIAERPFDAEFVLGAGVKNFSLVGNAGVDVVGNDSANTILGNSGANTLSGLGGTDTLSGGLGDDIFLIASPSEHSSTETVDGGGGTADRIRFTSATAGQTLILSNKVTNVEIVEIANAIGKADGTTTVHLSAAAVLQGMELRGNAGSNTLTGTGFNDVLIGAAGSDKLDGGSGRDFASYTGASAGVRADLQVPAINTGEAAGDSYVSVEGLIGSNFADDLRGNNNANAVSGGIGADKLYGRGGNDDLIGDLGADRLDGGEGIDAASYAKALAGVRADLQEATNNTGEAAGDSYILIEDLIGSDFADNLRGDGNANTVSGGLGADKLYGRYGDDVLKGGVGADLLDGGADKDAASYADASAGVTADLQVAANNTGEAAGDSYVLIEDLIGSNFSDILRGDANANTLRGGLARDLLYGRNGNDVLLGGQGNDHHDGGSGIDAASYADASAGVTADLQLAANNTGEAAGDSYVLIEDLIGSNFADILRGDANANTLRGGLARDLLYGRNGNDVLLGGQGNDHHDGGSGIDAASYADASAGVTADLQLAANNTGEAAGDSYVLIEDLIGSNFADILRGDANANTLRGGLARDLLYGRNGNDELIGGLGNDHHDGGAGVDAASYADASTGVLADLLVPANNTGEAAGDSYVLIEDLIGSGFGDNLRGTHSANTILGGGGGDLLYGRGGNDVLNGQAGIDTLHGGVDADIFVFDQALTAANADKISDFSVADDTIHIDDAVFAGLSTGALTSAAFRANTSGLAGDSSDRIIYETDTGKLYFDRDGTGNAFGSVHFATITNFATVGVLTHADFEVI